MDPVATLNRPAPNFTLPDLQGRNRGLQEWRGRVVILNFWSAECSWSERADQHMQGLLQAWGERVVLCSIAANANETRELVRRVSAERELPMLLLDQNQQVADLYGAQITPHTFVIDEQGVLRYQGAVDDLTFRRREPVQFYLREAVESVLAGRLPTPAETDPFGCTIVRHIID